MRTRSLGVLGLAAVVAWLVGACGASSTASTSSSPGAPVTVNVGESIVTVSNAAIYVAMDEGYFKNQNVTFNLTTLQSGATATQAIASGSIDYALAGSFDIATAAGQGIPLQAVVANVGITMEVCASKKFASDNHLTTSSSIQDIMSAFKGKTVGITGPHSAPDLVLRYLLPKYGNLKPDTDVKIVALGSVSAELTALQRGQIDGFIQSPPGCEQAAAAGTGVMLSRVGKLAGLNSVPQSVLYSRKDYLSSHKDVTQRVVAAIARGDDFARNPANTERVLTILKKYFNTIDDATLRELLTGLIQPIIPKDGKMTQSEWNTISTMLRTQGAIDQNLDTKEGNLWTNAYNQ